MDKIREIVKQTFLNLDKKQTLPTPRAYKQEFCSVAKTLNFTVDECVKFKEIINKLSNNEQSFVKKHNIETFEELIQLLMQRVETNQLNNVALLLQKSMKPSISLTLNEDLHRFSVKIGNSPELIFENDIQHEIEKFIIERIEMDQEELEKKAKEITILMTYMTKFLGDTIELNSKGGDNISQITKELESITSEDGLLVLQGKLLGAANNINSQIEKTTRNLKRGKDGVTALQKKVALLEIELHSLRKENEIDHLTGLLTRRWYDRQSKRLDEDFVKKEIDYAVVFFDIDHFKKVNDTYGHDAGDVVLSTFAKVLMKSTRDTDILGRYGGEEFIALVHFRNNSELHDYMQRIKSIVTGHMFKYGDTKIPITFSAGVALRSGHQTHEDSVKKADELLYKAKQSGRNKVIFEDGKEF